MKRSERKPLAEMTNTELRTEVAEWLGYRVKRLANGNGVLIHPDKTQIDLGGSPRIADHTYLKVAMDYHTPNWPDDLNAAVKDCTPAFQLPIQIYWSSHFKQWTFDIPGLARQVKYANDIPGIARAICEAYCDMKRKGS